MSRSHIIQLKSTQNNELFSKCVMESSILDPIEIKNGSVLQLKAAYLDFRNIPSSSIIIKQDTVYTFEFYYYYVPKGDNGIDINTTSKNIQNGYDASPYYRGSPYILMVNKEWLNSPYKFGKTYDPATGLYTPYSKQCTPANYMNTNAGANNWNFNDDFVPYVSSFQTPVLKKGAYTPEYIAQFFNTAFNNMQPNYTLSQNAPNDILFNKNIIDTGFKYNEGATTFFDYSGYSRGQFKCFTNYAFKDKTKNQANLQSYPNMFLDDNNQVQCSGGIQSTNSFYSPIIVQLMQYEYRVQLMYNTGDPNSGEIYENDNVPNKYPLFYFKSLYNLDSVDALNNSTGDFFHPSSYMMIGATEMSLIFDQNNLFSMNLHTPILNNSQTVIQYQSIDIGGISGSGAPPGYVMNEPYNFLSSADGATFSSTFCFSQSGGIMFKTVPDIFLNELGFQNITINMDDYAGNTATTYYFIDANKFVSITSDALIPLNLGGNTPISYPNDPNVTGGATNVYIEYQGNKSLYAVNQYKTSTKGHYLLRLTSGLSSYPQYQGSNSINNIVNIVSTYYLSNNAYLSTNLLTSSQYYHIGEPILLSYLRAEVVDPDNESEIIDCGSNNYCYIEILTPFEANTQPQIKHKQDEQKTGEININDLINKQHQLLLYTK